MIYDGAQLYVFSYTSDVLYETTTPRQSFYDLITQQAIFCLLHKSISKMPQDYDCFLTKDELEIAEFWRILKKLHVGQLFEHR